MLNHNTVAVAALTSAVMLSAARPARAQEKARAGNVGAFVVDEKLADTGKTLFAAKTCSACHTIGKGVLVGPDLDGVLNRRSQEWIRQWLHDPKAVLARDAYAQALKQKYKIEMPTLGLSEAEITALLNYLASQATIAK